MTTPLKRILNMELPPGQSAFLWGARQTGKSTYLKSQYPQAIYYDLLKKDSYIRLLKEPWLLREDVLALSDEQLQEAIIIDEVQKIPDLLDEVHWLIENTNAYFILCGSSARKLKRGAANLLGGRAWRFTFYPFVSMELKELDLLHALNTGLIPVHYMQTDARRSLVAYVVDYLKEEVYAEGLVRNLPSFARFLDAVAYTNGEMVNYSNIASDCGVNSKTVKEYFQILIDTLVGYYLEPFKKSIGRDIIIAMPKFYLFDVGVANRLAQKRIDALKGAAAGKSLEHFIFMEIIAYRGLKEREFDIRYWRTKTGLEVDFVLDKGRIAIEVKISNSVRKSDLKGLIAFTEDYKPELSMVVSLDPRKRMIQLPNNQQIIVYPYQEFLKALWLGEFA